jgi:hypothetical protein
VISSGGWNSMLWCSVTKLAISILHKNRLTSFTNPHLPFNYFHLPLWVLLRSGTSQQNHQHRWTLVTYQRLLYF